MRTTRRAVGRRAVAPLVALALLVGACAGDDQADAPEATADAGAEEKGDTGTESESGGEQAAQVVNDDCTTTEILNSLAEMSLDEREAQLTELAQDEGGITMYSALDAEDQDLIVQTFRDKYGIPDDNQFSGNPESTHQKFMQEVQAGRFEVDIYENTSIYQQIASREGVLAEYDSPYREELKEGAAISPYWVGNRFNIYAVGWNTDLTTRDDLPDDILGFADEEWEGRVSITSGNFDWYQAVRTWLEDERGMSEQEVGEFFDALASNAVVYDRNPLVTELNALGEFDVSVHHLQHIINRHKGQDPDVPLAWEPVVEPVVVRPNAHSISCNAPNPATAILFADWLISTEGQEEVIVGMLGREPTNENVEGGEIDPSQYTVLNVDVDAMVDEAEHWSAEWAEIVQKASVGSSG